MENNVEISRKVMVVEELVSQHIAAQIFSCGNLDGYRPSNVSRSKSLEAVNTTLYGKRDFTYVTKLKILR